MNKVMSLFMVLFCTVSLMAQGDIPPTTGIIAKDCLTGDTYDFDEKMR